ncbi:MAG: VWA domain-containing protein [Candidatus Margulisbacteria bacterium]|nr:VWA domain-containing protein [Candidatus Margulisiibacteriota bacterium]
MTKRKIGFLVFCLVASMFFAAGCSTVTSDPVNPNDSTTPADPPSGTTSVTLSGGSTTGTGNTLSLNFLAVDQASTTLTNITRGNVSIEVYDSNPGSSGISAAGLVGTVVINVLSSGANTSKPIAVGMVLDKSGSMMDPLSPGDAKVRTLEAAADIFIDLMSNDSQAAIINFDSVVSIEAAMTTDKNVLKIAASVEAPYGGSTAFFTGASTGITETAAVNSTNYVRGVIAMTDGANNYGSKTEYDVTTEAIAAGLPVYTVGLFDTSSEASSNRAPLQRIALATTGTSESYHEVIVGVTGLSVMSADQIRALGALEDIYTQLAQALTDAYTATCTLSTSLTAGQQYWVRITLHTYGTFSQSVVVSFIAQ